MFIKVLQASFGFLKGMCVREVRYHAETILTTDIERTVGYVVADFVQFADTQGCQLGPLLRKKIALWLEPISFPATQLNLNRVVGRITTARVVEGSGVKFDSFEEALTVLAVLLAKQSNESRGFLLGDGFAYLFPYPEGVVACRILAGSGNSRWLIEDSPIEGLAGSERWDTVRVILPTKSPWD